MKTADPSSPPSPTPTAEYDEFRLFDPLMRWEGNGIGLFGAIFVVGLFRPWLDEVILWIHELGLLFCFLTAILAHPFLRARRRVLFDAMKKFSRENDPFFNLYQDYVSHHEKGYKPTLVAMLAACFFLLTRATFMWDLFPYHHDLTRLAISFLGAVGFAVFVRAAWLFLAFAFLISRVSVELEMRQTELFSWALIERAGRGYARTALGAALFSFMTFWMVISSQSFMLYEGNLLAKAQFMLLMLIVAVGFPLSYLVLPLWRLHRILVRRKQEIRDLFKTEFRRVEQSFLEKPTKDLARDYLVERQIHQEIEALPEWPFSFGTLAQIVTMVALPTGLFIFKEIVIDVLVTLLKK